MKVLFDQNVPRNLARALEGHEVTRSIERGWDVKKNGDLLKLAEDNGFDVLVTGDRNMSYQQQVVDRRVAVVAVPTTNWPQLRECLAEVVKAVNQAARGTFQELPAYRSRKPRGPSL